MTELKEEKKVNDEVDEPSKVRRFRSIPGVVRELRKLDENTIVTPYMVRQLCDENRVFHIVWGNKIVVDMDDFLREINSPNFVR